MHPAQWQHQVINLLLLNSIAFNSDYRPQHVTSKHYTTFFFKINYGQTKAVKALCSIYNFPKVWIQLESHSTTGLGEAMKAVKVRQGLQCIAVQDLYMLTCHTSHSNTIVWCCLSHTMPCHTFTAHMGEY